MGGPSKVRDEGYGDTFKNIGSLRRHKELCLEGRNYGLPIHVHRSRKFEGAAGSVRLHSRKGAFAIDGNEKERQVFAWHPISPKALITLYCLQSCGTSVTHLLCSDMPQVNFWNHLSEMPRQFAVT